MWISSASEYLTNVNPLAAGDYTYPLFSQFNSRLMNCLVKLPFPIKHDITQSLTQWVLATLSNTVPPGSMEGVFQSVLHVSVEKVAVA